MKKKRLSCHHCIHYYITWDPDFPYGCHAMGFKSRRNPGLEVRQAMNGEECVIFSPKKSKKRATNHHIS